MVVDFSEGWGVDRGVGAGVDINDGITFGIYDGYDMSSSHGLFGVSNDIKPVFLLLYEYLE